MRLQFLIISLVTFCAELSAQTVIRVLDNEGLPLPGSHVTFNKISDTTSYYLITDNKGKAVIPEDYDGKKIAIKISFIGFENYTDTIKSGNDIAVNMSQKENMLAPNVITAQYLPGSVEQSTHKVKVVDKQKIESLGAVNLSDVLRQQNNMRISQDGILGSSMSMQGISGENVKILIDGVPMIGRQDGNINLDQINLNNVERIELVEGPLSVNYGSNALAGTINIITASESDYKWEGNAQYYQESVGQYNLDGQITWNHKNQQIKVSGGRNYFDGWSSSDSFFEPNRSERADTGRTKDRNPREQYFADASWRWQFGDLSVTPFVRLFDEKITNRGMPRAPYYEVAFDDYYKTKRFDKGVRMNMKLKNHKRVKFVFSYNEFQRIKNTYRIDLTTLDQQLTENPDDQDTSDFDLYMSRASLASGNPDKKLNYEIGYDISLEKAGGRRIEGGSKELGDYAVFGSLEYSPVQNLKIRPGARYSYNTGYEAPITPSVNLKYVINRLTIRTSYARGFRAPSLKELHFNFVDINHDIVGNEDLEAEQSNNYQANFTWKLAANRNLKNIQFGGYYNDVENLIFLGQTPGSINFTYLNVGVYQTIGLQGGFEWRFKNLSIMPGFAYIGRYNELSEDDNLDVDKFAYSPEFNAAVEYKLEKMKGHLNAFYKYTGKLPGFFVNENDEVIRTEIDDYNMLELSFTKNVMKGLFSITVGGKNMFDVRNVTSSQQGGGVHGGSASSVPVGWGRSVFVTLRMKLKQKNG